MKKYLVFIFVVLMGLCLVFASGEKMAGIPGADLSAKPKVLQSMSGVKPNIDFGKIPLYFITNKGQVNEKARFYAKALRYTLWLTKDGFVFDSSKEAKVKKKRESPHSPQSLHSPTPPKFHRDISRLLFLNSNKNPEMVPIDGTKLKVNYFIGNDKSKWHCDIPTSRAVLYKSLYKNIDLKVYGLEKQIEYDWIVKTGGDPRAIRIQYTNVKGTRLDEEGNLLIETAFGELMHKKPVSFQEVAMGTGESEGTACPKKRSYVNVTFKKLAENTYGFEVGAYDRSRELVIDPVVLAYSTFLGGGSNDYCKGIAVDGNGNAYVTGFTNSTDFPTLNQYQTVRGGQDVFVTKLVPTQNGASSLLYSTYLGGGVDDWGWGIAVDGSGNIYVTGCTLSTDFPTLNQYQTYQGEFDAFVTKLDPTQSGASSLLYSTYLGGSVSEEAHGIAVDCSGNAYIAGYTNSTNFPTLNQYQTYQDQIGSFDAFVTKLDPTQSGASSLLYSTYLGGGSLEFCFAIAVDGSGNAYVTGSTISTNFPTLNQYQGFQGSSDVFVSRLDPTQSGASSLLYSTYLGGGGYEHSYGIAVDSSGNAYVAGFTLSTNFPTLNQYQAHQGGRDVFVTKLDPTQSGASCLLYSTYLGGAGDDRSFGIAVDSSGDAYVTGYTSSTDFPTLNQYQAYQGGRDAFVAKLVPTQSGASSLFYSTYLGAEGTDDGYGIAVDGSGNAYVTGNTSSTNFPTLNPYQTHQGLYDGFVTKLAFGPGKTLTVTSPNGGEEWTIGSVQAITWDANGITEPLTITLWKDGQLQGNIADNIDPNTNSYTWTVGLHSGGGMAAPGTGYTIKIEENGTDISDTGDAAFTLANGPEVTVLLLDSNGNGISGGTVQYYNSGWITAGTTDQNGRLPIALPPLQSYTFRMTYGGGFINITQDVAADPVVVFQTSEVTIQLKDSSGNPLDTGTVSYYFGGWKTIGATSGGETKKELLPASYTFRMAYEGASINQAQNVAADPVVVFQTSEVTIQLKDSTGNPLDTGTVSYYFGGWKTIAATSGGETKKELLPASYTFRMTYEGASINQAQNVAADPVVVFQTSEVTIQLKDSTGNPLDTGTVSYYFGGWKTIAATSGGETKKELLPASYTFRMTYEGASINQAQNVATDPVVVYQTGKVVSTSNSCTDYHIGVWKVFTTGMELLPTTYTFRFNDGTPNTQILIVAGITNEIH